MREHNRSLYLEQGLWKEKHGPFLAQLLPFLINPFLVRISDKQIANGARNWRDPSFKGGHNMKVYSTFKFF